MQNISTYISNSKYKKLTSNFSYLVIIEAINKILPLLVVPYIVNILGIEKYGILAFSLAIIMYFKILTTYSFDLTATKYISQYREDKDKISQYYWTVLFTKFFLLLISFSILIISLTLFETLNQERVVLLFTFLMVIGEVMTPLWFFRGIEEMKYVAYLSVITKILYTASIFLIIKNENDYPIVALLSSLSHIIVGVIALYYIYRKFNITFYRPKLKEILYLIEEGKDIFLSKLSVSLYSTTNNILLGFLAGYTAVGIYSIANTIYGAFLQLVYVYNTVVYPYLAKYLKDKQEFLIQAKKLLALYIILLIISSILLYSSSEFIIELLFGKNNKETIEVLNIMALALIITPIGGYLTHFLALKSEYKTIRKITFYTMIINFIFVYPMIITYEEKGIVYLMIIVSLSQILLHLKYNQELFSSLKRKNI